MADGIKLLWKLPPNPYVNLSAPLEKSCFGDAVQCSATQRVLRAAATLIGAVLLPLRVVTVFVCVMLAWVASKISIVGVAPNAMGPDAEPLSLWRRAIQVGTVVPMCRTILFCFGFVTIETKGKLETLEKAPIVVANHTSFLDIFLMHVLLGVPVGLSAAENINFPIMGDMMVAFQTIFMDRESKVPGAGKKAIDAVTRCARDQRYPRVQIYPEGNTCNGAQLCAFKAGAFVSGMPVQPMIVRYTGDDHVVDKYNYKDEIGHRLDPCYVEPMGMPVHIVALRLLHRLRNTLSVEFLPVVQPTQAEMEKPELFAARVRAAMSEALGVPMVDASFTDTALMFQARKLRLPLDTGYIEADKVLRNWGLGMRECKAALQVFASFCAPSTSTRENAIDPSTMIESLQLDSGDMHRAVKALTYISKEQPVTFRSFLAAVPMIVETCGRGGGDASSPEDIKSACVQYIRNQ